MRFALWFLLISTEHGLDTAADGLQRCSLYLPQQTNKWFPPYKVK